MGEYVEIELKDDTIELARIQDGRWEMSERDTITRAVLVDAAGTIGEVTFEPGFDAGGIIPAGAQMSITTHRPTVSFTSDQLAVIERVMRTMFGST